MDLKEAIEAIEHNCHDAEIHGVVLAAARRELERQENAIFTSCRPGYTHEWRGVDAISAGCRWCGMKMPPLPTKPKRASLRDLELKVGGCTAFVPAWSRAAGDVDALLDTVNILKALRETVIPNLKRIGDLAEGTKDYGPFEALSYEALKSIGEGP